LPLWYLQTLLAWCPFGNFHRFNILNQYLYLEINKLTCLHEIDIPKCIKNCIFLRCRNVLLPNCLFQRVPNCLVSKRHSPIGNVNIYNVQLTFCNY
jgi:hypothetical protein